MLLDFFYRKQIQQNKIQERKLYQELSSLRKENEVLRELAEQHERQLTRIIYLQREFGDPSLQCSIEFTKKGHPVFIIANSDCSEIQIFDLNLKNPRASRSCVLWTITIDKENIFIKDIQGVPDCGYGQLAMKRLIEYATKHGYRCITGKLAKDDIMDHKERLSAFYCKFGFLVDFGNGKDFGSLQKYL